MRRCKLLGLLAVLLYGHFISAQTAVTSLRGAVTDPSGAMIAGAQVTLDDNANGFHASRTTDATGTYEFPQIRPAKYVITVTGAGFGRQSKEAELLVSQPATINFSMSVTSSETTVEVSGVAQTLNTTDATIGNAVSNGTIEALPMEGRNVPDLLSLQPGVVYLGRQVDADKDSRSGSVSGARSDQSNVTLDGLDDNDQTKGYAFTGVLRSTLDSVEEFRVTTTNSNADSGRSSGAQVNMVTKSGTNSIHGSLYEYNRNTFFAANDWFNKQAELTSGLRNKPGSLLRNTYGASIGGPIKKDKLFFFVNYEGQRTSENKQQTQTVPTASLRQGIMKYPDANGNIVSLSPSQLAAMDPNCQSNGSCPWGPGDDPNALAVMNKYPLPNGFNAGDGLNTDSYTWSAPNPTTLNTYIAKLDYAMSDKMHLFVRGNLLGDRISNPPQFPGDPPSSTQVNNSKGIAAGHTWTIGNNLINNFRYGYIRQGISSPGAGNASYVNFGTITPLDSEIRSTILNVPVHNFVDDFTWVKGKHTLQFGANYRLVHNNTLSDATSYNTAQMIPGLMSPASIADASTPQQKVDLDPSGYGYPLVNNSFTNSYDNAVMSVAGIISYVIDNSNYQVSKNGQTGSILPTGALIPRDYKANEFEWYVQDSWRVKPNLTVTFGVRHTLLQTPYEVNGQQISPDIDMHQWFETRAIQAAIGNSVQPSFSFSPAGQARGLKPYWPMNKNNFAPRLAMAFSPNADNGIWHALFGGAGKTSIRAGAGMYYDHFGEGIVDSFSQYGSFGLSSSTTSPQNVYTVGDAPRYTGLNDIPNVVTPPASTVSYPATPSNNINGSGFAIAYGLDNHLKTPYSIAADLSIQRELPHGFTVEAAYVGRFGRHQLQQMDLAAPLDLVDKKSGMDYYGASRLMDQAVDQGKTTVAPIPYWENLFPGAAQGGNTATQNIYTYLFQTNRGNEVAIPFYLDVICYVPGLANSPCGSQSQRFWPLQYSSLYAWVSNGNSSYNGGQFMLRHAMSHGLQMDLSYTFSKSIDMGSDAERSSSTGGYTAFSEIIDPWNPSKNRGPSDFDTRHVVTGNWVYELPFGRGKSFAPNASGVLQGILGGWQLSGLVRWTGGFPFSIQNSTGWGTNWNFRSYMVHTGPIKTHTHVDANGSPQAFADPAALQASISTGSPWRMPYAGEVGSRNNFRGDGFFGVDSGLGKSWKVTENQALRFTWEVFNVTNSVRFDSNPNTSLDNLSTDSSMGVYSKTLTAPRVQQFSLRYSF
ncbi:MAG: Cna domain protein [Acidobacteriaceae bacterium]|nr:Cna domain protein [Acidobacteriaceae bacterium]